MGEHYETSTGHWEGPQLMVEAGEQTNILETYGFKAHELNEIERTVREHWAELMEAWHEHLG